ncbi:MAG: TRAP transporter large permease subunit [Treponema sp.]|jgi:tripartite ATP-independent transporter DctM subunit|nr:TRAP transporter large permease subunit [Treponema sp.]
MAREKKPEESRKEDAKGGIGIFLYRIENILCVISLVSLALLPAAEAAARLFFRSGVPASSGLVAHLLLAGGLLAGMITTRNNEHLSIALVQYFSGETVKRRLRIFSGLLSAFVAAVIAWSALSFVKIGLQGRMIGFIPDRVFAFVIPLGFGIIAIRFARRTGLKGWKKIFPVLALLFGTAASFPVIAKFIWGFDLPDGVFDLCDKLYLLAYYAKIPLVIFLLVAALGGTPLFVVMGGLALLLLEASGGEMDSVASDIYSALTNSNIIAIPLFTLVGFFLSESKAGERLVYTFRSLFSWLPGGIIIAAVIICAFFTSFTGASGVTILALGGILYTILSEHMKYPEKFSIGLLTSTGSIGLLFPPSLPIILVGAASMTNIFHLFLGGLFPGLILVAAVIIFGIIASVRIKIPVEKFDGRKALSGLKGSALEILLPFFLITGYFTGSLSLVEIGATGAIYIFIVEVLIHRDIKAADIFGVFIKAVPIIGGVLSILALSKALSYYIVDTQAPANLAKWMQSAITSKYVFLLLLNLALLVVGCLMDIFSAILIVLPLVVPLGQAYGIDPVHLGIIFITNLEVGFLTPPVGLNLFLASYRFNKSFVDICRYVFPFLLIQLVVVALVTYVPWLSTYLTRFF